MEGYFFIIFCMLVLFTNIISGQSECKPNTKPYSGPAIPKIPDRFSVDIVHAFAPYPGTVEKEAVYHLYVDAKRKLAVEVPGKDYNHGGKRTIFDNNRKEAMVIEGNKCQVFKFSDLPRDPLLPYGPTDFSTGNEFIRFGEKFNPTFNGTTHDGKVNATLWGQCLKALGKNNTGNIYVMYMFINDANGGVHFTGYQSTSPSRVIYGRAHNGFLGAVSPEQLNVPPEIFCNMSKTDYKMPKMPDEFEMNIELIMARNKSGFNVRDYVDTKEKYFRSDHHHKENGIWVPVHEIHDFNTGISYMINSRTFACEVTPLTNRSWDATETDDHHHIRMRTTDEFFGLDHNDYVYEGYTKVREVPADIFSRLRPSRRHPGRNIIQKWYFSRPEWKIGGMEGPLNDSRVPLMLTFTTNGTTTAMSFFNYDPIETTNHILWPLRACFKNNRHYMYFRLEGQFDAYGVKDQRSLTNGIRDTLAMVGKISKLRVSSVLIFKSGYGGVVAVRVYVLGVPNIKGSVQVLKPVHETPLKKAVDGIRDAIMTGKFAVKFPSTSKGQAVEVTMSAVKSSYYDLYVDGPDPVAPGPKGDGKKQAGMTRGAVAAIVLAMVVVAVILTVGVLHVILKRRGVQLFNYSRHTDEATA